MDNTNTPKDQQKTILRKKRNKTWLFVVFVVALLGAFAACGWLYHSSTQTVLQQNAQISDLRKQLQDLGVVGPIEPGGRGATCSGGSTYSAAIANFVITVSEPNVIIRNLDANFEGGPITDLTIGRCIVGETNVVDTHPNQKITILGHPTTNAATLRTNFEAEWGSPLTPSAPVTIDGVVAQTYTGSGLFTTKLVYFDHGGIGYQIKLPDVNPTTEAMLTDVISDWSFTP